MTGTPKGLPTVAMSQLGGGAGGDAGRCQRPVTIAECRPSGPGDERRLVGEELFVELADGVSTGRRAVVWQRQDCPWLVERHQAFDVARVGSLDEEPSQVLRDRRLSTFVHFIHRVRPFSLESTVDSWRKKHPASRRQNRARNRIVER